jgi:hypothetical protein
MRSTRSAKQVYEMDLIPLGTERTTFQTLGFGKLLKILRLQRSIVSTLKSEVGGALCTLESFLPNPNFPRALFSPGYNLCILPTFSDAGSIKKLAGGSGRGYKNGPALEARFDHIGGVEWDDLGNFYVADIRNNVIRKLDKNGRGAVPFLKMTRCCSDLVAKGANAKSLLVIQSPQSDLNKSFSYCVSFNFRTNVLGLNWPNGGSAYQVKTSVYRTPEVHVVQFKADHR